MKAPGQVEQTSPSNPPEQPSENALESTEKVIQDRIASAVKAALENNQARPDD